MLQNLHLTIAVDNSASMENSSLRAEHGLSVLVELDLGSDGVKLLWDTGASGEVLLHNCRLLHIDIDAIDLICLSHGHYDHTGGLMAVLQQMKRMVPVLAHPDIFAPKLKARPTLKFIGLPFTRAEAEAAGAETQCVLTISENTWASYYGSWRGGREMAMWAQNVIQNASSGTSGSLSPDGDSPVSLGQIAVRAEVIASYSLK